MASVLLPWFEDMTWLQQSTYLSALRGPDNAYAHNVKQVVKLLRVTSQQDAKPGSNYMSWSHVLDLKQLEHELEFCSLHYVAHLVAALVLLRDHCRQSSYAGHADGLVTWFAQAYHLAPFPAPPHA